MLAGQEVDIDTNRGVLDDKALVMSEDDNFPDVTLSYPEYCQRVLDLVDAMKKDGCDQEEISTWEDKAYHYHPLGRSLGHIISLRLLPKIPTLFLILHPSYYPNPLRILPAIPTMINAAAPEN
jgi:hypothetical protein